MPALETETDESGMDDAFYSEPESRDDGGEEKETPESIDEEEAKNPTALIPTSALGGSAKEGDTITMKVVKMYGDEAEVEISSSGKPTIKPPSPDEELDDMASMKGRYGSM